MTRCTVRYRARQFLRALGAHPTAAELTQTRQLLSEPHWRLFRAMAPRDQWHSIETLRLLRERGQASEDLALAALLHDAGKGHVRLHERVLYVLLARWPWLLRQLAAERGPHWRSALYRTAGHAVSGARLACEAGANARVTHLIRHHHCATTADTELLALIEADDRA